MGWSGEKNGYNGQSRGCADNECMDDFKNELGGYKTCQQVDELRAELREIQSIADKQGVGAPECLLMINRNYGIIWSTIKMGNMATIKRFVQNNCKNMLKICYPEWAKKLESNKLYQDDINIKQVNTEITKLSEKMGEIS